MPFDPSDPPFVRRAKISLRADELKAAGKWDFAAYEQLRGEWIDACSGVGEALGYFNDAFDGAHLEFAARLMEEYRARDKQVPRWTTKVDFWRLGNR